MSLLEQVQSWHENDEHQRIIDALEALPEGERTPETDSLLARAYLFLIPEKNRADTGRLARQAIGLLAPHEETLKEDHYWNYRMGYAHHCLDLDAAALGYFQKALELEPEDKDSQNAAEVCKRLLAAPAESMGLTPFRVRCREGWQSFREGEAELRALLDRPDRNEVSQRLVERCAQLLSPAFREVAFELGRGEEKYELILTPEGDRAKLFQLVYFQRRAPREVLEHWDIRVGRIRTPDFCLQMKGQEISAGDARVWVEKGKDKRVCLSVYCQKLLPLLREDEGSAYNLMFILLDMTLGELAVMWYIDRLDLLESPGEGEGIPLAELAAWLEQEDPEGWPEAHDPLAACQRYVAYRMEPSQDKEVLLRQDTYAGMSCCMPLLSAYLRGDDSMMDRLHQDGVAPGFLCWPVAGKDPKELPDLRDAMEKKVLKKAGVDAVTFTGGATGTRCVYLDFIAWDLQQVLQAVQEVFPAEGICDVEFHTFRQNAGSLSLAAPRSGDNEVGDKDRNSKK